MSKWAKVRSSCWEEKLRLNLGLMTMMKIISYWATQHHFIISCYMLKCRTLKLKKLVREGTGKCVTGERSAVHSGSGSVTIKGLREGRECTKEAKRACGPLSWTSTSQSSSRRRISRWCILIRLFSLPGTCPHLCPLCQHQTFPAQHTVPHNPSNFYFSLLLLCIL